MRYRFRNNSSASVRRGFKRGFTLIEILIVIVVIAILAAILFPVFGRAREGARRAACASNMRQLGMAFLQYSQDSNRKYPFAGNFQSWADGGHWVTAGRNFSNGEHGLAGPAPNFTWNGAATPVVTPNTALVEQGALYPYVKSADAFVCPSTENARDKRLGYSMNCAVSGLSDARIRQPTEIVLLVDEGKSLNDGFFWAVNDSANDDDDELTQVHNGGGNLLFADGHVKFTVFSKFPLDGSAQGKANKTTMTGSPRFHDRAFGSRLGSSLAGADFTTDGAGLSSSTLDSCAQPIAGATPDQPGV
jgi:prepilin-type N-terminal cleavage/methylation domain-containing protein/prepilin-type processing-associated H-X9-DG protein